MTASDDLKTALDKLAADAARAGFDDFHVRIHPRALEHFADAVTIGTDGTTLLGGRKFVVDPHMHEKLMSAWSHDEIPNRIGLAVVDVPERF